MILWQKTDLFMSKMYYSRYKKLDYKDYPIYRFNGDEMFEHEELKQFVMQFLTDTHTLNKSTKWKKYYLSISSNVKQNLMNK